MSAAQRAIIDRLNYLNDRRTHKRKELQTEFELADGTIYKLPTCMEVCTTCGGHGTHVTPSLDAGGLTLEELNADPEFAEDYRNGCYDVTCSECKGKNVVRVIDVDQLPDGIREAYEEHRRIERDVERQMYYETRAEILAGC